MCDFFVSVLVLNKILPGGDGDGARAMGAGSAMPFGVMERCEPLPAVDARPWVGESGHNKPDPELDLEISTRDTKVSKMEVKGGTTFAKSFVRC